MPSKSSRFNAGRLPFIFPPPLMARRRKRVSVRQLVLGSQLVLGTVFGDARAGTGEERPFGTVLEQHRIGVVDMGVYYLIPGLSTGRLAKQAEAAVGTANGQVPHRAGRHSTSPVLAHLVVDPECTVHEGQMGLVDMLERSIAERCDRGQEHHRASGA